MTIPTWFIYAVFVPCAVLLLIGVLMVAAVWREHRKTSGRF